jgi:short-subunit dehydrogenase
MKTILITGCDSGIGKFFVDTYSANQDVRIIATVEKMQSINHWQNNANVIALPLDITNKNQLGDFQKKLVEFNYKISTLILNAGVSNWGPLLSIDEIELESVINVNLIGTLSVLRRTLPHLSQDGKVILLGSTSRLLTIPFMGIYPIVKNCLHQVADRLRLEQEITYPSSAIQYTMIDPGSISTEIWQKARKIKFHTQTNENILIHNIGIKFLEQEYRNASHPSTIANLLIKIIQKKKIARVYYAGSGATIIRILALLPPFLRELFFKLSFRFELKKLQADRIKYVS